MTSNFILLKEAIRNKQQCTAMYDWYHREFCPHVLWSGKDGSESCLVYQFAGNTSSWAITSETKDNWRCIKVSGLQNLQIQDGAWHTFGNHSEEQTCVREVDFKVDF